MENLRMYTREEVAEMLHSHPNTISVLREEGVLKAIKVGKNYLFPKSTICDFQNDYLGLDCSNREKAAESRRIVENRKQILGKESA